MIVSVDDGAKRPRVENITTALLTNPVVAGRPVDFLLGPYLSTLTESASHVASQRGALLMSAGASSADVFVNRSLSFGMLSPATTYLQSGVALLHAKGVRSVALMVEYNDPASVQYCDGVKATAKELGMRIAISADVPVASQQSPANRTQIARALDQFRSSKPDAIVGCTKYDNCAEFLKQAAADPGFYVQAVIFTLCVTDIRFKELPREQTAYVMGVTPWFEGDTQADDLLKWSPADFDTKYRTLFVQTPPYQAAAAFGGGQLLVKAIEDSDSLEPKRVAATLARMRVRTVYGNVSFNLNRQNVVPYLTVQQKFDKSLQAFSVGVVTAQDAVIPMPLRGQRKCELGEPPLYKNPCTDLGGCQDDGNCVHAACPDGFSTSLDTNVTLAAQRCRKCRPGYYSTSGTVSTCTACSPGTCASVACLALSALLRRAQTQSCFSPWRCPRPFAPVHCRLLQPPHAPAHAHRPLTSTSSLPLSDTLIHSFALTGPLEGARHVLGLPGHFQPIEAQQVCINCDSLGNSYQEEWGATTCIRCPPNFQRYIGVLSGANRSSCQCKAGVFVCAHALGLLASTGATQ